MESDEINSLSTSPFEFINDSGNNNSGFNNNSYNYCGSSNSSSDHSFNYNYNNNNNNNNNKNSKNNNGFNGLFNFNNRTKNSTGSNISTDKSSVSSGSPLSSLTSKFSFGAKKTLDLFQQFRNNNNKNLVGYNFNSIDFLHHQEVYQNEIVDISDDEDDKNSNNNNRNNNNNNYDEYNNNDHSLQLNGSTNSNGYTVHKHPFNINNINPEFKLEEPTYTIKYKFNENQTESHYSSQNNISNENNINNNNSNNSNNYSYESDNSSPLNSYQNNDNGPNNYYFNSKNSILYNG
ncbi:hypothetical protein DICPUDRAFT_159631 [Dictyostelium purpureum]|uniref:Uncharacterized protein n=1 Tax=Dictyostelium purpureum TaxID=5786 RepID=F1A4K9_DICPU|nr:uncharacterized protein DICPUDRAFT_159631 [Dictyostelium purpureum]EGC28874.1 hypothetical protein DICPUDRAFT_159631 [Dictyostelium purpureum]|eukprot:XP_003294603.1 hypothetical protein DICPUDRAFT_159631 [Dictyostelium purpureum]